MEDDELVDVPTANVGEVAQAAADAGYKSITCTKVSDDNWTILASEG